VTHAVQPASAGDDSEGDSPFICPTIPIPFDEALPTGRLFPRDARDGHVRIYVTFRPNPGAARGFTTVCSRDGFGRPVIVHMNFHAAFIATAYANDLRNAQTGQARMAKSMARATVLHEVMHALALTTRSMQQYRNLSRRLRGNVLSDHDVRGVEAQFLITPSAFYALRQHYRIVAPPSNDPNAVPGLEIVGPTTETNLVRWRKRSDELCMGLAWGTLNGGTQCKPSSPRQCARSTQSILHGTTRHTARAKGRIP
jgi:hypothetical protein